MPTLLIKRQKKAIKKTMRELPEKEFKNEEAKRTLSSEPLAALSVDALIDAGIIDKQRVPEAIEIAAEEIEVRKTLGGY
ncbi:hypothetical protein [Microcoleus vaginatus]|uniref:hypothetical protein n=1 Tax=Microcoleus vaginatus TaxID=119532 RepID=UPI001F625622|nr:hypothetical protein D0A37_02555 [Microcoleus vaginatus HSN003]